MSECVILGPDLDPTGFPGALASLAHAYVSMCRVSIRIYNYFPPDRLRRRTCCQSLFLEPLKIRLITLRVYTYMYNVCSGRGVRNEKRYLKPFFLPVNYFFNTSESVRGVWPVHPSSGILLPVIYYPRGNSFISCKFIYIYISRNCCCRFSRGRGKKAAADKSRGGQKTRGPPMKKVGGFSAVYCRRRTP